MQSPKTLPRVRLSFLTAGGAFCAATLFAAVAYAAASAPGPVIGIEVKESAGAPAGGSGGAKGGTSKSQNDVFYTFILTNNGKVPLTGATVEYHVYVKSTIGSGISVTDNPGTAEIAELAPGEKKVIEAPSVRREVVKKGGTSGIAKPDKKGVVNIKSGGGGIESSAPIGTYIVINVGDKKITEKQTPTNVLKEVAAIEKAMAK